MIVVPGHARTGTQITWFGATPGGYLGGQLIRLPTIGRILRAISQVGRYRP
jgi:hypothetical protein